MPRLLAKYRPEARILVLTSQPPDLATAARTQQATHQQLLTVARLLILGKSAACSARTCRCRECRRLTRVALESGAGSERVAAQINVSRGVTALLLPPELRGNRTSDTHLELGGAAAVKRGWVEEGEMAVGVRRSDGLHNLGAEPSSPAGLGSTTAAAWGERRSSPSSPTGRAGGGGRPRSNSNSELPAHLYGDLVRVMQCSRDGVGPCP